MLSRRPWIGVGHAGCGRPGPDILTEGRNSVEAFEAFTRTGPIPVIRVFRVQIVHRQGPHVFSFATGGTSSAGANLNVAITLRVMSGASRDPARSPALRIATPFRDRPILLRSK